MTELQKAAAEKDAAKKLVLEHDAMVKSLPGLETGMSTMTEELKDMKKSFEDYKDIDIKKTMVLIEELKSGQQQLREMVRNSKGRGWFPGVEDTGKKFSLLRAAIAHRTKNWGDAGYEQEVIKAATEAVRKAGATIGQDSTGGAFVPDQVIPDVIGAIYTQSVLIGFEGIGQTRVSVLEGLVGMPVKIPRFDGGCIAYWMGEQDKYAEAQASVGNVTMTPKKLGVLTRITDEMRRFSSYGFEALLRNDLTRAAAKLIDYTILYGTGSADQPRGIVNVPGIFVYSAQAATSIGATSLDLPITAYPATPAGAELTYDGLMNMMGILEDANLTVNSSFAFISHPRYFRRILQQKISFFSGQTTNQAYLAGVPILTSDRLREVIGDYAGSTQIPTQNKPGATFGWASPANTPKCTDVFGVNWSEVLFGRWGGVEILDDNGLGIGFGRDETFIKFRTYADVGHRQEKNIVICPDALCR